ncbi:MAG: hypothetical protein K8R49_03025 [Candidatus Cloacimonetes bacterium]|nr:hypothetical protein [Candidatus Cloacimonadota bacterium]
MKKICLFLLFFILISCVMNIGDVNQRKGKLISGCKKLLKKPKEEVLPAMLELDMGEPFKIEATSDSTETYFFYKRYVKKRKNRYYDEVILDFKKDIVMKYKVEVVR